MKSNYILTFESFNMGTFEYAISEGDIILEKDSEDECFQVLPAMYDEIKPNTPRKVSDIRYNASERLMRIKELGEDSAVVARLCQEFYRNVDTNTEEVREWEELQTVKYGEPFFIYATYRFQPRDGGPFSSISHSFSIMKTAKPQERVEGISEPQTRKAQNFCTECGAKWIKGDKFCRECGAPVLR